MRAVAVSIHGAGPGVIPSARNGDASTYVTIQGDLAPPAYKDIRNVLVTVSRADRGVPVCGRVFPGGSTWNVVVNLPPLPFSDVLALALSGRLATFSVATERLERGRGGILSASFGSVPVPLERDE